MTDESKRQPPAPRPDLESFRGLWPGGYHEGFPLDPGSGSTYGPLGYMSVLHVAYLACIRPYVTSETVALEIGPGRGSWSRTMLGARELWCLDVLSAEETQFHEYVGRHDHVRYIQVNDFECRELPDAHFDYLFSFGCLCHIPFEGIRAYARSLFRKLRPGAHAFIMVADFAKYRRAMADAGKLDVVRREIREKLERRPLLRPFVPLVLPRRNFGGWELREDDAPVPGRWYDAGVGRTCEMLRECGYTVLDPDVGVNLRDPVIHFTR